METTIQLLNPDEILEMTLTASGQNTGIPDVSARAIGVTATPKINGEATAYFRWTLPLTIGMLFVWVVLESRKQMLDLKVGDQEDWEEKDQERKAALELFDQQIEKFERENDRWLQEQQKLYKGYERGAPASEQLIFSILNQAGLSYLYFQMAQALKH